MTGRASKRAAPRPQFVALPDGTLRSRYRVGLSQAEMQGLFEFLMRGPPFSADPEYGAFSTTSIAEDINALRAALFGPEIPPFHWVEIDVDGFLLCTPLTADEIRERRRIDALIAADMMRAERPRRGRPALSDTVAGRIRFGLIEAIYYAFGRRGVKLTQREGVRPGSHFEEVVAEALRLAGDPVENVHRECLVVIRRIRADRTRP
ncbi:hypothetical protein FBR04_19235 [Betaproteobacteria bacterium PRO7]|jgi:hypothetical protein|nr:hypothetical protein [Betaproteobacteria bacterium PRO7]